MRIAQTGFTLMELLVVIAIASVLTGLAVPSFRDSIRSAEARNAATAFYTALNRARSEAIASNSQVSICARDVSNLGTPACANGSNSTAWKNGWIVFKGTTLNTTPILINEPLPDQFNLGSVTSPQTFFGNGQVAAEVRFDLCHVSDATRGRRLIVTRSGRVSLEQRDCT